MKMLKKFLLCLLVCQLSINAAVDTAHKKKSGPMTYKEVGDNYLASFGIIQEKHIDNSEDKKLDLTPPQLTDQEKRQMIFEILDKEVQLKSKDDASFDEALRVLLSDLDVYYGQGKDTQETLLSKLDYTITTAGQVGLASALANPRPMIQIMLRQNLIKELVANPTFLAEIEAILQAVKKSESGFLSYWRDQDAMVEKAIEDRYFSKLGLSKFNENPYILEGGVRLGNAGTFFNLINELFILFGTNYLSLWLQRKENPENFSVKKAAQNSFDILRNFFDPSSYIKTFKNMEAALDKNELIERSRIIKLEGEALQKAEAQIAETRKFATKMNYVGHGLRGGLATFYLFSKINSGKAALAHAAQVRDTINYMQGRLTNVATIVNACQDVKTLAQKHRSLSDGILQFDAFYRLFNGGRSEDKNSEFANLINLLQTNTFKGSPSFFSLSGKVLAAHKLMVKHKNSFALAIAALGELDACVSIAKLVKESQSNRVGYCFVDFIQSNKPSLKINGFWNPFVNPDIVVTNDLSMNDETGSKIILTGSNTGGKSTILKAIMTSLLLGSTFGIAPAQTLVMTPFDFIGSYLRVNDDTAAGESKFKAEVLRAKMLCQTLESLNPSQKAFVVIDELFTGTSADKAADAAAKVAEKLAGLDNNLYILATHFKSLTELEKVNSQIKNYKVDIYKDESGNLVRPFKLEPGISSSNVATDILHEELESIDFSL